MLRVFGLLTLLILFATSVAPSPLFAQPPLAGPGRASRIDPYQQPLALDPPPLAKSAVEPAVDWRELARPRYRLAAQWAPAVDGFGIATYDAAVTVPSYPFFGPPPPLFTAGYRATQLDSPSTVDLPSDLHRFHLDVAWMRRINDRWTTRLTLGTVFASDMHNRGGDAWRVRAGGFALFQPNERWSFAFGALATGRDDLPVIPAVGLVYQPSPSLRINLMMPEPRIEWLYAEAGERQTWLYLGAGIGGDTWGVTRQTGAEDRLSLREFKLTVGLESRNRRPPGSFVPTGNVWTVEAGVVLGRRFEFERDAQEVKLDDALMIRTAMRF